MRFSILRLLLVSTLMLCFAGTLTFGQGTSASLSGQITDATGAAVTGAAVTAKEIETNLTQSATSNAEGVYSIAPLPPGNYSLTVEAKGFSRYVQMGIVLGVNISATQNVSLKPGSVNETVTITENAELINTTTAELGTTVDAAEITELPLNGRDPSTLVLLSPGTTLVAGQNGPSGGGQPGIQAGFSFPTETGASVNGGRQGSAYYLLDGVPNMDNYLGITAPFPNADATEEFRVITNNFNALYGFAPNAVVSIETKSGTNKFHGGAFYFIRNKALNAPNDYFSNQYGNPPEADPLRRNQFGGYAGGPIIKNKLFVFGNYQERKETSASAEQQQQTPTAAMLAGDFSGVNQTLCGSSASLEGPNCPFGTIGGVPNQLLPGFSYNSAAVALTEAGLPPGQQPNGTVFYPGGAFITNLKEFTGKLDYNISSNQRISLRNFLNTLTEPSGDIPGNILSVINTNPWGQTFQEKMEFYSEAINHTWEISPKAVNTLSVFWTQMSAHNAAATVDKSGKPICWSRYITVSEPSCYMEGFQVSNGFNGGYTEPSQEVRTTYGVYETFSKTVGKHLISVGATLQHQYAKEDAQYPAQAILSFNGQYTGNGLADFLMGYLHGFTQGAGEIAALAGWQPGFFGQDQYRVLPNLSITAGLRWDPNLNPSVAGGRGAAFVPGQQSTLYPNAPLGLVFPGDKGISQGLAPNTYGYWQPRLGVAWQPHSLPHTSIRAGFGLFTAPLLYSTYNHSADISPFAPTFGLNGGGTTPIPLSDPWSINPGTGGVSPFPPFSPFKPPSNSAFATPITLGASLAQNFKLGTTQSWNLSVQQAFGENMVLEVAYVGSESYHLPLIEDQNPGICGPVVNNSCTNGNGAGARLLYPNFSSILTDFSAATASYNGLQATIKRHFSKGLQFQSSFTWSKTLDTVSNGNISFGTNDIADPFNLGFDRGISGLNVPFIWVSNLVYHTPSLSGKDQFVRQTLGGWEVSGIITLQSGFPFTIGGGNGGDKSGALKYNDRADVVPGQPFDVRQGSKSHWLNNYFNPAAFSPNLAGTYGDSGRNMFQGPPIKTMDLAFAKNWTIIEGYKLQFRWEMFNALNHPSFGDPDTSATDGSYFGKITGFGPIPARVMQAGLKFSF
ncbi:MAG: carboxypeptidase regulatory-like domain-containing protein [Terriglobales bacterium]